MNKIIACQFKKKTSEPKLLQRSAKRSGASKSGYGLLKALTLAVIVAQINSSSKPLKKEEMEIEALFRLPANGGAGEESPFLAEIRYFTERPHLLKIRDGILSAMADGILPLEAKTLVKDDITINKKGVFKGKGNKINFEIAFLINYINDNGYEKARVDVEKYLIDLLNSPIVRMVLEGETGAFGIDFGGNSRILSVHDYVSYACLKFRDIANSAGANIHVYFNPFDPENSFVPPPILVNLDKAEQCWPKEFGPFSLSALEDKLSHLYPRAGAIDASVERYLGHLFRLPKEIIEPFVTREKGTILPPPIRLCEHKIAGKASSIVFRDFSQTKQDRDVRNKFISEVEASCKNHKKYSAMPQRKYQNDGKRSKKPR